jgi:hypothetical protein
LAVTAHGCLAVRLRQNRSDFLQKLGLPVADARLVLVIDLRRQQKQNINVTGRSNAGQFAP